MSSVPGSRDRLQPSYMPNLARQESISTQSIISALDLEKHIEGGYFAEIDRNPLTIPNPFLVQTCHDSGSQTAPERVPEDSHVRSASTSIYYLLSPVSPHGHFHRNKGRTVHTLIEGRGRYVLIHADEEGDKKRVESFLVGKDVANGEKSVWIVEGGKYKASFLLPLQDMKNKDTDRLLISETVVPGFEYADHDFLTMEKFGQLITKEQQQELEWLVRIS